MGVVWKQYGKKMFSMIQGHYVSGKRSEIEPLGPYVRYGRWWGMLWKITQLVHKPPIRLL